MHRIGRTARAGKDGKAIALCDRSERNLLRGIERVIRQPIPVLKGLPFESKGGPDHAPSHDDSSLGGQQRSRFGRGRSGPGFRPMQRGALAGAARPALAAAAGSFDHRRRTCARSSDRHRKQPSLGVLGRDDGLIAGIQVRRSQPGARRAQRLS